MLEEFWGCMELFKMSYNDVLSMPVYIRKFMIGLKVKQREIEEERMEKSSNKNGGKTVFSGDTLKSKLNNNEIPL